MRIVRLHDHPELASGFSDLTSLWPEFMLADPIADLYYSRLERWADHVLLAVDEGTRVVGCALGVPFHLGADVGRPRLPRSGWDGVIRWSWLDDLAGREPTHLSALEVTVAPEARGSGLAAELIGALGDTAHHAGGLDFVAPVRPSRKHLEPATPMAAYAARTREDGLPADPWLRLHVRLGGRILEVCPTSMTIAGTLDQWRDWTGLAFDHSGQVEVPGALTPVHADQDHDYAVYVEPNVWVHHPRRDR